VQRMAKRDGLTLLQEASEMASPLRGAKKVSLLFKKDWKKCLHE